MTKAPSNETLSNKIDNLTKLVEDGFTGVHARQDTTNGKVIKDTEHRIKLESNLATFKWLFGALGIGNIVIFLKTFI